MNSRQIKQILNTLDNSDGETIKMLYWFCRGLTETQIAAKVKPQTGTIRTRLNTISAKFSVAYMLNGEEPPKPLNNFSYREITEEVGNIVLGELGQLNPDWNKYPFEISEEATNPVIPPQSQTEETNWIEISIFSFLAIFLLFGVWRVIQLTAWDCHPLTSSILCGLIDQNEPTAVTEDPPLQATDTPAPQDTFTPLPTEDPATQEAIIATSVKATEEVRDVTRSYESTANAQIAISTAIVETVSAGETLTAQAIPTLTPSSTPTPTETPTITPTPTETPTPSLTPTPFLEMGSAWDTGLVKMSVTNIKMNPWENTGINLYRWAVGFRIKIENNSRQTIFLDYAGSQFTLVDDAGRSFTCDIYNGSSGFQSRKTVTLEDSKSHEQWMYCGRGRTIESDVVIVYFTADSITPSLGTLTWTLTIPRG